MTTTRILVLSAISSPDWSPVSESYGMPWDDATVLVDNYAVEVARAERAATYRAAADLIDVDDTCGGCDSCIPQKLAARLRERAEEISPASAEQPPTVAPAEPAHAEPHLDAYGRCTCDERCCVDPANDRCVCGPCTCPGEL